MRRCLAIAVSLLVLATSASSAARAVQRPHHGFDRSENRTVISLRDPDDDLNIGAAVDGRIVEATDGELATLGGADISHVRVVVRGGARPLLRIDLRVEDLHRRRGLAYGFVVSLGARASLTASSAAGRTSPVSTSLLTDSGYEVRVCENAKMKARNARDTLAVRVPVSCVAAMGVTVARIGTLISAQQTSHGRSGQRIASTYDVGPRTRAVSFSAS